MPVVLHHGFFGGRTFPGTSLSYFRGVEEHLQALGHTVLVTEVPATASVQVRAESLVNQIHRWPQRTGRRVAVLAHSMGGLDVRFAVAKLGADSLVDTVLTISTPHRGSPVADICLRAANALSLTEAMRKMPQRLLSDMPDGGRSLSTAYAEEFNAEVRNSPEVTYLSVAGDRGSAIRTSPELMATYLLVYNAEGPNDGLVSVSSARWGRYVETLDMDHIHQVNFPLLHRWISGAPSYDEVLDVYARFAGTVTDRLKNASGR